MAIKHPFGKYPAVVTLAETSSNVYDYAVQYPVEILLKGTALGAAAALNLTAHADLAAGTIFMVRWLCDGTGRAVTVKPLIHANGNAFTGTASKQSTLTLIYNGTIFLPVAFVASIDVS
jgi:hypothetical protein